MDQSSTRSSAKPKEQPRVKPGPGGTPSRRPLHFYWLVDASGSMDGEKINALNKAIRDTLPNMRNAAAAKNQHNIELKVSTIVFHDKAERLASAIPVDQFEWNDLEAGGETAMGAALGLAIDDVNKMLENRQRIVPPVLVLVSDGMPTDKDLFLNNLEALDNSIWGSKALRIAISFSGPYECEEELLIKFAGTKDHVYSVNNNPEKLTEIIKWASTTMTSKQSDAPAGKIQGSNSQQAKFSSPSPSSDKSLFDFEDVWEDEK